MADSKMELAAPISQMFGQVETYGAKKPNLHIRSTSRIRELQVRVAEALPVCWLMLPDSMLAYDAPPVYWSHAHPA